MRLEAGDVHWIDLDPVLGSEQAGRRPAVIVSGLDFNSRSPRIVVCPITSRMLDWPVVVRLPDFMKTRGVVLCDQVRSIDRARRLFGYIESVPDDTLFQIRDVLGAILTLEPPAGA
jgi:mRNA interferase MazF